jgi:hypothetical protein
MMVVALAVGLGRTSPRSWSPSEPGASIAGLRHRSSRGAPVEAKRGARRLRGDLLTAADRGRTASQAMDVAAELEGTVHTGEQERGGASVATYLPLPPSRSRRRNGR